MSDEQLRDEVIVARRDARAAAIESFTYLREECDAMPASAREAYWTALQRELSAVRPPNTPVEISQPVPMTEVETRAFSNETCPTRRFYGERVGSMAGELDGWEYLSWLAKQTFVDRLRRYLATPHVYQRVHIVDTEEPEDGEE